MRTRGTPDNEDRWVQRTREPIGTEHQGVQRIRGYRGSEGTEDQRAQRTNG